MTTHRDNILEAARGYIQQGIQITPLKEKSKKPVLDDWPNQHIPADALEHVFSQGNPNVGIKLGDVSGVVDVDLDCDEARALAPHILPRTDAVFGKTSTPWAHLLYRCPSAPNTTKFQHPEMGMLVEIRSNGAQTMAPPSIHPSGEGVAFTSKGCAPTEIQADALLQGVNLLAISIITLRHYPAKGNRNDFCLAFAGALLRVGCWTVEEVEKAMQGVAYLAEDEEWQERIKVVRTTHEALGKGEPVTGFPALEKFLGEQNTDVIKKWCKKLNPDCLQHDSTDPNALIDQMNEKFSFVLVGGKGVVMRVHQENGYVELEFIDVNALKNYLKNTTVYNPIKQKFVTHADFWLEHPKRSTYERIIFAPGQEVANCFNIWQGFSIEPKEGDCSKFLWHVEHIICGGNKEHFQYIIAWLASTIQEPTKKVGTSLVVRGKQGTGKSQFVSYFASLFGPHYFVAEDPRFITGRFNGHLFSCIILHAEEGFWAGDKTSEGKLKEMITGDTMTIEFKGKEPIRVKNYIRLMVTGNPSWVVPAAFEERRFFVLEASEDRIQDHAYFAELVHEMENGGRAALLHYLQNYDYSQVNLRQIPKTAALFEQKIASMDSISKWWLDVLMRGRLPQQDSWSRTLGAEDAVTDYCEHANRTGERRRAIETEFGRRFKKLVPNRIKHYGAFVTRTDLGEKIELKGYYYALPSLSEARKQFEEQVGQEIDWDDVPAEVTQLRKGFY